ncbi:acid protease [Favolaschia claudopus]|uniref:Acid protease n=1 Tax=Favolaschia claudopus TaxID=2862362 RepID=A0AAW0C3K2_9AGAR
MKIILGLLLLALVGFSCSASTPSRPIISIPLFKSRTIQLSALFNATLGITATQVHQIHTRHGSRRLATFLARTQACSSPSVYSVSPLQNCHPGRGFRRAKHPPAPKVSGTTTQSIPLQIEANDIGYYASFFLGTPLREYRLLVDSGSADMWVGGERCKGADGGNCGNHKFLGPRSSSSYRETEQPWYMTYGSGVVSGILVNDTVKLGILPPLRNFTFGVTEEESPQFTADDIPFDGVLGCAKDSLSMQQTPTLLNALRNAGLISERIWSYKISRYSDGKNDGELTIGSMDTSKYKANSLVRVPNMSSAGFWEIELGSVTVNGQILNLGRRSCILDTGTTLLIAPKSDVATIHDSIPGAKHDNSSNTWTVPCNTTASIALMIGNKSFPIQSEDLAFLPLENSTTMCTSAIAEGGVSEGRTHWLCGNTVLKNVYLSTNEDTDQISVARVGLAA